MLVPRVARCPFLVVRHLAREPDEGSEGGRRLRTDRVEKEPGHCAGIGLEKRLQPVREVTLRRMQKSGRRTRLAWTVGLDQEVEAAPTPSRLPDRLLRKTHGVIPVHRLNARSNELDSENPNRHATS
jgi:hypothetical protein